MASPSHWPNPTGDEKVSELVDVVCADAQLRVEEAAGEVRKSIQRIATIFHFLFFSFNWDQSSTKTGIFACCVLCAYNSVWFMVGAQ